MRWAYPLERVKVRQGDPDRAPHDDRQSHRRLALDGRRRHGVPHRGQKLIEHGKSLAAEELGVEPSQVSYSKGEFSAKDSKKKITLAQLAAKKTLAAKGEGTFGSTFPNGCHIAEVEIDPETGVTEIASYLSVDDCGVVVNHAIVEGQMHGAVVQGAGQVFGEHASTTAIPGSCSPAASAITSCRARGSSEIHANGRARHAVEGRARSASRAWANRAAPLRCRRWSTRCGRAAPLGMQHLDMPLTPSKVWKAIQQCQRATN